MQAAVLLFFWLHDTKTIANKMLGEAYPKTSKVFFHNILPFSLIAFTTLRNNRSSVAGGSTAGSAFLPRENSATEVSQGKIDWEEPFYSSVAARLHLSSLASVLALRPQHTPLSPWSLLTTTRLAPPVPRSMSQGAHSPLHLPLRRGVPWVPGG